MSRQVIHTENAPAAIGTYSQAIFSWQYTIPFRSDWFRPIQYGVG